MQSERKNKDDTSRFNAEKAINEMNRKIEISEKFPVGFHALIDESNYWDMYDIQGYFVSIKG